MKVAITLPAVLELAMLTELAMHNTMPAYKLAAA